MSSNTDIEFLANHLVNLTKHEPSNNNNKRWIIGVIGIPCSGKSIFAERLRNYVNGIANKEICEYIGMDGFHYTRKHLDSMDDPKLAHQKRGAYWTFDCYALSDLLYDISININNNIIAPTFDHSIKDPSPNGKTIKPNHKIIIIEGLYLFLNIKPWNEIIRPYFNEQWLLKCDWRLAENRIISRHVKSGIVKNKKDALFRWTDNDKPNGELLLKHLDIKQVNVTMKSTNNGIKITNINWNNISKL